jgi:hypothetical protein
VAVVDSANWPTQELLQVVEVHQVAEEHQEVLAKPIDRQTVSVLQGLMVTVATMAETKNRNQMALILPSLSLAREVVLCDVILGHLCQEGAVGLDVFVLAHLRNCTK